jgi:hypothetical protein
MTPQQAKALTVADRVCWDDDFTDQGTVLERDWSGVRIKWDRNAAPIFYYHNDMRRVTKLSGRR